ncbi:MAG: hypothetical protein JOZ54_03585 [Acidobacteria bacterium]|nr:hypothetical protein [Acidobacteriota bacterium]
MTASVMEVAEQSNPTARILGCKTETNPLGTILTRPELPFHPTIPGVELDFDNRVGVPVGDRMATVIPSSGLFGPCGDLGDLLRKPRVWGMIINCFGEPWTVDSEPTIGNAFGLLVRNERGRCVMSGEGEIVNAIDGSTDDKVARPTMRFSVKTVYANAGAQRRTVTAGGTVTNTGWQVTATASWTF